VERLRKAERFLVSVEKAILTGFVAFMTALAFAQVALRHLGRLTGTPLSLLWGETLLRHLVLWLGFLGACVAASEDKQFAMDAMNRVWSPRGKAIAAFVCHVFTVLVCAGLLVASVGFFREEMANSEPLFTLAGVGVPAWIFETILPAGFALLLIHYSIKSVEAFITASASPARVKKTAIQAVGEF
jgi:TRAP-type C4-dicarboxylate transport system permease small subunit